MWFSEENDSVARIVLRLLCCQSAVQGLSGAPPGASIVLIMGTESCQI